MIDFKLPIVCSLEPVTALGWGWYSFGPVPNCPLAPSAVVFQSDNVWLITFLG